MRRTRRRLTLLIVTACSAALLGTAGTTAADAATAPTTSVVSRGVRIPAFYTPPATLPARDGALVRTQPLELALSLPGLSGTLPGKATRIMYTTTDSRGVRVAVSGAYLEPVERWGGAGPRPLVVLAPGTMGQGDQCTTSLALERGVVLGSSSASVGYEALAAYRMLAKGIAVVVTDYVGLGTPGLAHTYVNRVDGAHAVLDAARAARSLPGTSLTSRSPLGLYGYSQGGGAVAAAAELAATYAPELPLRATYSGAPPANLADVAAAIDGTELAGALGWSVTGFVQSDPSLQPLLDRYVSAAGKTALADLSTMCIGDAVAAYANKRSSAWTTTGQSLSAIIAAEPRLTAFVGRQLIGTGRPTGAVRLATGVADDLVPHQQARRLAVSWCARGGAVTYVPVAGITTPSPLLNHAAPLLADQEDAIGWVTRRLAGSPAPGNCGALPLLP